MTTAEMYATMEERDTEGESVDRTFEGAQKIGSESMYPAPGVEVRVPGNEDLPVLIGALLSVDIDPQDFKKLDTFEEMFAALFAWKFKTMIAKQTDYGPENISKAGEKGVITRMQDKVERLKVLVGDSDNQVAKLKKLLEDGDPENRTEMGAFLKTMQEILYPEAKNESILDTWGDAGNYGDIGATLHLGAWPKPLYKDTQ